MTWLDSSPPKRFLSAPGEFLPSREVEARVAALRDDLQHNPENLAVLVELGVVLYQKGPGSYPEAVNLLHRAWELGALDERIFYYSGLIYESLNLPGMATQSYERFLRHEPGHEQINLRLGNLYVHAKRLDEALDRFEAAYRDHPHSLPALCNLGWAYQAKGMNEEALERFQAAERIAGPAGLPKEAVKTLAALRGGK